MVITFDSEVQIVQYETSDDQALWMATQNGSREAYEHWTRQWHKIPNKGRETRFPADKIHKLRGDKPMSSSYSIVNTGDSKKHYHKARNPEWEAPQSLDHFVTIATAIDMAIDLQNEVATDDATIVQLRQLTFAWITDETGRKLQCLVFGNGEGHGQYGRHFRINRENYIKLEPIEAYRRYGYALELRVGHQANTWNDHFHVGFTDILESLFIPMPFEEVDDYTMTKRWSLVYNKLRNLPANTPTAPYTPLRQHCPSASLRDAAESKCHGAQHTKRFLEDKAKNICDEVHRLDDESPGGESSLMQFECGILDILREWPCTFTNTQHLDGQLREMLYPINSQFIQQSVFGMVSGLTGGPPIVSKETEDFPHGADVRTVGSEFKHGRPRELVEVYDYQNCEDPGCI